MSEFVQGVRTNGRVDNKMLVMDAQQGLYIVVKMIKSKRLHNYIWRRAEIANIIIGSWLGSERNSRLNQ